MSSAKSFILMAVAAGFPVAEGMRRKAGGDIDFNSMWSLYQQANGSNASLLKNESAPVPVVAAELDALVKNQSVKLSSSHISNASLVKEQVKLPSPNASLTKKQNEEPHLVEEKVESPSPNASLTKKLQEQVKSPPPDASLTKKQADEPCNTLLWNLVMQSKNADGWKDARLVVSHCNGTALHEKTLSTGSMAQEALCLPVLFNIHVHAGSQVDGLQWTLTAQGAKEFAGSAPFKGGFCLAGSEAAQSLVQQQQEAHPKPSAWSQWWKDLHHRTVAYYTLNQTEKEEVAHILGAQTFRFYRSARVG